MSSARPGVGFSGFSVMFVLVLVIYTAGQVRSNAHRDEGLDIVDCEVESEISVPSGPPNEKTIPGLAASFLHGYCVPKFRTQISSGEGQGFCLQCLKDVDGCRFYTSCVGTGFTTIEAVGGSVTTIAKQEISQPAAKEFLGQVASMKYTGSEPEKAKAWVENHVGETSETVIGGVKFQLTRTENRIDLAMTRSESSRQ
jgi:hypothetical protein